MRAYGANNPEEAKKAHKARNRRPFADLDPMADVKEAPAISAPPGHQAGGGDQTGFTRSVSRAQPRSAWPGCAARPWAANPTACNDLIRARFGESVPEEAWRSWLKPLRPFYAPARQCAAL